MNTRDLGDRTYVNLETFKRDGTGVKTPVWVAELDGRLVVFTDGTSWKVKRLRRDPRVRVAACGVMGALEGPWVEGRGVVVGDPQREARAYEVLLAKYGLQMRLIDFFSWLSGRIRRRAILEIELDA
jgi:PPOX class probable F420-dependent enzyme